METEGARRRVATARTVPSTATAAAPHFVYETVRGREAFLKLRREWDAALNAGTDPTPALEHDFLRIWLENFAPAIPPTVLVARRQARLSGALPLLFEQTRIQGVPVRLARSPANPHSTRGGLLLGREGLDVVDPLLRRLLDEEWDVLQMRDLPREGGALDAMGRFLAANGCSIHLDGLMDSPYLSIPSSWEELERRLDSKFRQNLRRRRRRLAEHGELTFEVITGGDGLDAALEDAFEIEASGWKGKEGTAIRSRPEQVGFYSAWARLLARTGRLRLCFLSVGGRRVAFHFALVASGHYLLPKCGYDQRYSECSPGQLLMVDVLRRCIDERLETFDFLGHSMTWKRDWTPLVRPHACLWAFRPTPRGRLAHLTRARIRPVAASLFRTLKTRLGVQEGAR